MAESVNTIPTFNYQSSKTMYESLCVNYIDKTNLSECEHGLDTPPLTSEAIEACIEQLQTTKSVLNIIYDVIEDGGETILIARNRTDGIRKVVPVLEMFDLLVDAHILYTNHGTQIRIWEMLRQKYVFPKICTDFIVTACNICETKNDKVEFNKVVNVNIMKMFYDDGQLTHLLIYHDTGTHFTILRAMASESETEIAVELIKIFADFETPPICQILIHQMELFKKVIKILESSWDKQPLLVIGVNRIFLDLNIKIIDLLKKWMCDNKSNSWGIGCLIIQRNINSKVEFQHDVYGKTPYDWVFRNSSSQKLEHLRNAKKKSRPRKKAKVSKEVEKDLTIKVENETD